MNIPRLRHRPGRSLRLLLLLLLTSLGWMVWMRGVSARVQPAPSAPVPTSHLEGPPLDDEIVLLTAEGRITVVDPHVALGYRAVSFTSDSTGWEHIAVGDVNGDGDDEIVALKANEIRVFDPVPRETPADWHMAPPEGQWTHIALGDVDGDGQAEILAAHTRPSETGPARVVVLDPNAPATEFHQIFARTLEVPVKLLAAGDVDGDGWDDGVVLGDIRALFYAFSGGMWDTLVYYFEIKPWKAVAVGQVHVDSRQEEIATSRQPPEGWDSYILFRWIGGGRVIRVDQVPYFPTMDDVAAVDMNGDGDDELLFIRSDDSEVPLVVRNPAGYVLPRDIRIWCGPGWKRIAGGDLDGDGWGEIVILKERAYRIFTSPELNDDFETHLGSFKTELAVGNLDGEGIPDKPILRLSANGVSFRYEAYIPPPAQAITVENAGAGGSITWTARIVGDADWLHVEPTSGRTPGRLVISVTPEHLPSGVYTSTIEVSAPGALESPQYVDVTLMVVQPRLDVQPRTFAFDAQRGHPPMNQIAVIQNVSVGGSIGWHAHVGTGQEWLRVEPDAGHTPGDLVVIVDPTVMDVGTHVGTVVVAADDPLVDGSPITLTVIATIRPPVLSVTPKSIYLNLWPNETYTPPRISVVQAGVPEGHAIHWVAGVIPSVREVAPSAGNVAPVVHLDEQGATLLLDGHEVFMPYLDWVTLDPWYGITPSVFVVRVDNEHMAPGIYYATIIVDGGEGTENRFQGVDLTVVIPAQQIHMPWISVSEP